MGIVRKYRKRPMVVKAYQTDMATSPLKYCRKCQMSICYNISGILSRGQ